MNEEVTIQAGRYALVPLTDESDNNWSLHIDDAGVIISFDYVTWENGTYHCWRNGTPFAVDGSLDSPVPDEILGKLNELVKQDD